MAPAYRVSEPIFPAPMANLSAREPTPTIFGGTGQASQTGAGSAAKATRLTIISVLRQTRWAATDSRITGFSSVPVSQGTGQ